MIANKGDYVRCIDNLSDLGNMVLPLTIGKEYKVIKLLLSDNDDILYNILNDDNCILNYYDWRFELDICSTRKNKLKQIYDSE